MKKYLKILLATDAVCLLLGVTIVSAAGIGDAWRNLDNSGAVSGLNDRVESSAGTVVTAILSIVGTVFFILMVYAGYLWLTAAGNSDRADKGKRILTEAVVGIVITLASLAITNFIGGRLIGK